MDARDIILQLYKTGKLRQIARKLAVPDLAEDLEHEIVLLLYLKPAAKIEELHKSGHLLFYIHRMAINLHDSGNSKFQRDYRQNDKLVYYTDEPPDRVDEPYDCRVDDIYARAMEVMDSWAKDGAYPYDKQLFLLWLDVQNKRLIERQTKIPWRSISYTINNCKERLKYELGPDYYIAFGHYDFLDDE